MKKIICTIITLCCLYSIAECQSSGWFIQNPLPTSETLNDIRVLNNDKAIAVGYDGTVIRTSNGGINWSNPLTTSAISGLEKLHYFKILFFDQNTGLILGNDASSNSKILKTTNGGITWSLFSDFSSHGLAYSMSFLNQNTGCLGIALNIYKTTNSGATWQLSPMVFPSQITNVLFLDSTIVYATVYNKIFKSFDGGLNWSEVNTIQGTYGGLYFINNQIGFAVGTSTPINSLIQKTTDGGLTWVTKLLNSGTNILSSICFINSTTGVAVGGNYWDTAAIFRTVDGGESWNLIPNTCSYHINAVQFSSSNLGLAVAYGGKVLRSIDGGQSWSVSPGFQPPAMTFYALSFVDPNTGWVTTGNNASGSIYKTINGGINWVMISTPAPYLIDYIQFLNANTGYFSIGSSIYKSTNSGFNWEALAQPDITVYSVWFRDASTGWACGYKMNGYSQISKLVKTTNGALSWDSISVPNGYSYGSTAFCFVNDNTGWICNRYYLYPQGFYSKIFRTTNNGISWSDQHTDTNIYFTVLDFVNSTTGWAAGYGILLKTTNAGDNWTSQSNGLASTSVMALQFINPLVGWVFIQYYCSAIYKTTNGGNNWYPQFDVGLSGLNGMQFINDLTGWAIGEEGTILRTTNGGEFVNTKNIKTLIPKEYYLSQNYPNPFNPKTIINFQLPMYTKVNLTIYDILGREVAVLVNERLKPGTYQVTWDGSNYASGIYFYKLVAGTFTETKKMVLIK